MTIGFVVVLPFAGVGAEAVNVQISSRSSRDNISRHGFDGSSESGASGSGSDSQFLIFGGIGNLEGAIVLSTRISAGVGLPKKLQGGRIKILQHYIQIISG